MSTFNPLPNKLFTKQASLKHCGKGENICIMHFLLFPQCFLCYENKLTICTRINMLSANPLNLDQSKILLTLSQTIPCFYVSPVQVFFNTIGKREIARNEQFLLFPWCFLPILRTFPLFIKVKIVICELFLNFVVWERVNQKRVYL